MTVETLAQGVLNVQLFLKPLEEEADFVPCERMRLLGIVMLQCLPAVNSRRPSPFSPVRYLTEAPLSDFAVSRTPRKMQLVRPIRSCLRVSCL